MLKSEVDKHKPVTNDDAQEADREATKSKIRNAADIQRLKLEKLMKNPTKLVNIPEKRTQTKQITAPEFVRNVMGSSAGAGSGEFHVYRNLRRKELARQKALAELVKRDEMDQEYETRKNEKQSECEKKTAKKREKRKKKKEKIRMKKKAKCDVLDSEKEKNVLSQNSRDDDDDDDNDDNQDNGQDRCPLNEN